MFLLTSHKTNQLKRNILKKILILKNSHYKYGYASQLEYFENSFKSNDIHNILYFKKKIIGYTALRNINIKIYKKKEKCFLFDTLIIDKKFRKKKLASIIMAFNNYQIKNNFKFAILFCEKNLLNFYKKYSWEKLSQKHIDFKKYNKNLMIYNLK